MTVVPDTPEAGQDEWRDLGAELDQELSRLPGKYQVPIILCELEGKTHKEAACQLGWPQGTLSVRLARAKSILATRLSRRGVVPSVLAAMLAQSTALASVPPALVGSTLKAATLYAAGKAAMGAISARITVLTKGVLISMFLTKVKQLAAIVLLVCMVSAGAVVTSHVLRAEPEGAATTTQEKDRAKKSDEVVPKPGAAADTRIRQLLKERVATLRELVRITNDNYNEGRTPQETVFQPYKLLVNAELEVCESDKDRIAVYERALAFAKKIEEIAEANDKNGNRPHDRFLTAVAYRLDAEIAYERAKAKTAPTPK